ncbi:hypothetical protein SAMN05444414_104175 [Roseovarius marisflavi]|uniref:Cell envelope biogenesis protein OmpA n=2 Tax=Roseovarius marisflavi TaxID=1054996 RepID=A0A1M6XKX3_9RHOB|nr:hypothetical protein SAMN05444414_104175 [Roseovarius marisflavi]
MMKTVKLALALPIIGLLAACEGGAHGAIGSDKTSDRGTDRKHLSQLQAGIWIDPNGCDHWIIDDGVEGYLSQRLDKFGKPVCSGVGPATVATGNFKGGSSIPDSL